MNHNAENKKRLREVYIFDGTGSKTTVRAQKQLLMTELETAAKSLGEAEKKLVEFTRELQPLKEQFEAFDENYRYLKNEAAVVLFAEINACKLHRKDFYNKVQQVTAQITETNRIILGLRTGIEKLRKNVIYLDEVLMRDAKVVKLNAYRRKS